MLSLVLYLSLAVDNGGKNSILVIELDGNIHLPKTVYLEYARLDDRSIYGELDINVIRDRIQKHPYVDKVELKQTGSNLHVTISEKQFDALLMVNDTQYLITDNSVLLPLLQFTEKIDYPIISDPLLSGNLETMNSVKQQKDVVTALKILTSVKLLNPDLYENISEVNLRSGKDIVIYLSNSEYPIVIGRNQEVRKIINFSNLWNYIKGKEVDDIISYIDLRYKNKIFLGLNTVNNNDGADRI
jgi:cell division septal protein FtsQ